MNESLSNHRQAFEAIKLIPADDGAARQNQLAAARAELLKELEQIAPERAAEITALREIATDVNVSNETIDSYIRIIESAS